MTALVTLGGCCVSSRVMCFSVLFCLSDWPPFSSSFMQFLTMIAAIKGEFVGMQWVRFIMRVQDAI